MTDYLNSVDPRLFHLAIAVAVGALVFGVKNAFPGAWARLPRQWQALPAILIGALLSGTATSGELVDIVSNALAGGFDGLLAVGGHHAAKRIFAGDL